VLEFIASLLAICSLLPTVEERHMTASLTHTHVHLWTDNTACMSWMLTNRVAHPLHLFLCQVVTLIRLHFNLTLTVGHIPGSRNVFADAASRQFDQPERDGPLLEALALLPRLPFPTVLTDAIVRHARLESEITSQSALAALTVLDGVRGWSSHQRTSSVLSSSERPRESLCGRS
jgi:hypothetical protein